MREIAVDREDGSIELKVSPLPNFAWHTPRLHVPTIQWQPRMGITRYEFARRTTPPHQRPFWESLRKLYRERPPRILPLDLRERMLAAQTIMPNGMPGFSQEDFEELSKVLDDYEHHVVSPCTQWRFQICLHDTPFLHDRLGCSCRDYRTLPDWTLLMRLRSWLLDDDQHAFLWTPPQIDGQLEAYENGRFNNLQWSVPVDAEEVERRNDGTREGTA